MYKWRQMTEDQRKKTMADRQQNRRPWHSPAHRVSETTLYHLTAVCFEHRAWIGTTSNRMATFEGELLQTLHDDCREVIAWTVLPNHYHVLVDTLDVESALRSLGRMHGRLSYQWNLDEGCKGRQVWYNAVETAMKSERHFWATINYILHNAVKHGYVTRWTDWPYCNAADYLAAVGREQATSNWREYPIDNYGADWDPPDL